LNYVQHIFPGEAKIFSGGAKPPAPPSSYGYGFDHNKSYSQALFHMKNFTSVAKQFGISSIY